MADFTDARQSIDNNIYSNGRQEITGEKLNTVLNDIVDAADDQISQLSQEVDGLALGKFYGFFVSTDTLPSGDDAGYAYVGAQSPFAIYVFKDGGWSNSGSVYGPAEGNGKDIDTNASGKLQFADRPNTDGMGYVILRKDKTFAEQVTQANTIYEIRYDFTLGEDITIPENCVLEFDGGSISGDNILTFSYTLLEGTIKIYSRFTGTVLNTYLNVDNFSETNDVTNAFQDIVSVTNVLLSGKNYITTAQINVPSNRHIKGVNGTKIYNDTSNTINIVGDNVTIEGISFESNSTETLAQYIIYVRPTHRRIYLHHCSFEKATGGIFTEYEIECMEVHDCIFDNMVYIPTSETDGAGGYGICISHKDQPNDYTWGGRDMIFTNNTFKEGVYRHCFYIQSCENVIIANNIMYGKNQQKYTGYEVAINVRGSKTLLIESNILNNGHALYNCVSSRYYGVPSNIVIRGNTINNTQAATYRDLGAIHAVGKNYLIDGNVFNSTGAYDVRIDNAEEVTISNNVLSKTTPKEGIMILSTCKNVDIINNSFSGHSIGVRVYGGTMNNISICGNRINSQNYAISFVRYSIVANSKMIIDGNIAYKEFQIAGITGLNNLKLLKISNNQFAKFPSFAGLTISTIIVKNNNTNSSLTGGRSFGSTDSRPSYMTEGVNEIGFMYFNTTTNTPNFWDGTKWVDATGTEV